MLTCNKKGTLFFSKKKTSFGLINFFYELFQRTFWVKSSLIRQKGEYLNGCSKKTKYAKFSEKRTFRTPWYADSYLRTPCRFKIRPFALLPTKCSRYFRLLTYSASTQKSSPTHAIRRIKPKKCLSVFDYFVGFALKGLTLSCIILKNGQIFCVNTTRF